MNFKKLTQEKSIPFLQILGKPPEQPWHGLMIT